MSYKTSRPRAAFLAGALFACILSIQPLRATAPGGERGPSANKARLIRSLGTGAYVWHLDKIGSPEVVARLAARLGLGSLIIKGADGASFFGDQDVLWDTVYALQRRNIRVVIWGYTRANRPDREADIAIELLHHSGVCSFVFDIEDATETPRRERWEPLRRLIQTVRAHRDECSDCKHKLLGCAVPAWISRHPNLPYEIVLREMDYVSPMLYWGEMGKSVEECVMRCYREFRAFEGRTGISVPILPLGQCNEGLGDNGEREVLTFARMTRGYFASAYWDLEGAGEAGLLGALRRAARYRPAREARR